MSSFIVLRLVCLAVVVTAQEFENCESRLVSSVPDDKLTASSYWCQSGGPHRDACVSAGFPDGSSAKHARLNSTGWLTGRWTALTQDANQFIQVDFGTRKRITGVVLRGRDYQPDSVMQYVKAFKVKTSSDCNTFVTMKDESGGDQTFAGNTSPDDQVTVYFDTIKKARCVQINPTAWENYISLRFDILGA